MKQASILLARRYASALRKYLQGDSEADAEAPGRLGRRTLAAGLETLELARMHEQAMSTVLIPNGSSKTRRVLSKRADLFFARANAAMAETHRTTERGGLAWQELNAALARRTDQLAAANVRIKQGTADRKVTEDALKERSQLHGKCLEESLQLQKRLRQLTHRLFAAQEDERRRIGRELENEIGQTLLAINVRLLTLKREARHGTTALKESIASTQRLVMNSVQTVRQVASRAGKRPAGP